MSGHMTEWGLRSVVVTGLLNVGINCRLDAEICRLVQDLLRHLKSTPVQSWF